MSGPASVTGMTVGSRGLSPFKKVFSVVRRFSSGLSSMVSSALNVEYELCNCRCDRVVHSLVDICFYNNSYVRSIAARLVCRLSLRPALHAYDTSAVLETVGRLARSGVSCASSANGACSFGATSGLGALLLGYLLSAKRLGRNRKCSISFSRRFVRTRGCSTGPACGGFLNCHPNITIVNSLVINVRGDSNGAGIHFRRGSALGEFFREFRRGGLVVGHFETSYNSYSRRVIRRVTGRYGAFCVHTGQYDSLCGSVFTLEN